MAGNIFEKPAQAAADALSTPDPNAAGNAELVNSAARAFANPPIGLVNEAANAVTQAFAPPPAVPGAAPAPLPGEDPALAPGAEPQQPLQQLAAPQLQQPQALQMPATMRLHESQVKEGLKLDPALVAEFDTAQNTRERGLKLQHTADVEQSVIAAQAHEDIAKDRESAVNEFIASAKKRQDAVAAANDRIQKRQQQVEAGVNPGRMWENMDGGRKALALIGLAFSSFGSAITKRPDAAWEMFNNAINQDIDAQKANIANAQKNNEQDMSSIKSMMDIGMSEDQAILTRRGLSRGVLEDQLKAKIAQASDQKLKGQYLELLARSQQDGAKEKVGLAKLQQDEAIYASKEVPLSAGGESADKAEKARMDKREYYRKRLADSATPEGQYAAARRDKEDFSNFKTSGVPSVAILNFIATGLKQGSFGPNLKELADSPGGLEKAVEAARKMLVGGERPEFMRNIERALEIKQKLQKQKAGAVLQEMTADGVNPDEFFGSPSADEKAEKYGGKALQ